MLLIDITNTANEDLVALSPGSALDAQALEGRDRPTALVASRG